MIKAYDSGPEFAVRYTIVIGSSVFTMSHNADQPNGVNLYAGELAFRQKHYMGLKELVLGELPKGVLIAIIHRLDALPLIKEV